MPAGAYNFTCEQGATFSRTVTVKDSAGNAQNLAGYTARMHVRKHVDSADTILELTTENGRIAISAATGVLTLTLTPTVTSGVTISGVYDLEIVSPSGEVTRVIEGQFILKKNVTR